MPIILLYGVVQVSKLSLDHFICKGEVTIFLYVEISVDLSVCRSVQHDFQLELPFSEKNAELILCSLWNLPLTLVNLYFLIILLLFIFLCSFFNYLTFVCFSLFVFFNYLTFVLFSLFVKIINFSSYKGFLF